MLNFDGFFLETFQKFDSNNESRSSFSRFSITRVLKLLTTLIPKLEDDIEEKLKEPNEKHSQSVLNQILKSKQLNFLNMPKKEEFLTYENWKKIQEMSEPPSNISQEIKYKEFVEKVFKLLQQQQESDNVRTKSECLDEKNKNLSSIRKKSVDIEKQLALNEKWAEIQSKLNEQLQSEEFRKYFCEFLVDELNDKSYLSVTHCNFMKFITIIKDILKCY